MFFPDRRSALRSASAIIIVLLLLIFYFPLDTWHITDDELILESPLLETTSLSIPTQIAEIPQKLWYKLGPRGMNPQGKEWVESCIEKNPTYEPQLMTDFSGDVYVKERFAHRPDIVEAFLALQVPILKADILRYILLLNEGGVYSDLDVSCNEIPIQDWIPDQYKKNASLVVGWEFDIGWGDNFIREFATWTIMARPGSPHLSMVLDDIMEGLAEKTREHNVTVADLTWNMIGDVVDLTGPRRMTRSILKSLKAILGDKFDEMSINNISEPVLVGDVFVLPGYSFALSSNRYRPEDTQGPALVTHHFDGSWKNDHGGETIDAVEP